jgi:putative hydrolase of the HAD superfamily
MDIRLAIFDLGRVVFDFDWQRAFAVWARYTAVPAGMVEADLDDDVHAVFERGEITAEQFFAHAARVHDLALTFEQFAEGWNAIYGPVYPEVEAALRRLSGRVPVVAFTNTNELHRPAWTGRYDDVLALFDEVFVSSLVGLRKPERRGFEHILGRFGVEPRQALFFDDMAENVEAAAALGLHAVQVREPADVIRGLERHGLLQGG